MFSLCLSIHRGEGEAVLCSLVPGPWSLVPDPFLEREGSRVPLSWSWPGGGVKYLCSSPGLGEGDGRGRGARGNLVRTTTELPLPQARTRTGVPPL